MLSATDPSGFDAAQLGTAYVNGWFAAASNGIQTISIADLRALLQFQPGPEPLGGGSPDGGGASGQQNTKQKHKACQSESGARSNSTTPTPVTDANGNPVMGTNSNGSQSPMQAPAGLPLSVYEAAGHEVADLNAIAVYGLSMPAAIAANGVNAYNLVNMRDGGSLDAQRIGGTFNPQFTAYANYAYGVYTSAAGMPLDSALEGANLHGSFTTENGKGLAPYTDILPANVANITNGYDANKGGQLCTP